MVVAALLPATHKCNVVFPLAGTCSRGEAGHHAGEVVVVGVAVADEEDVLVILGQLRGAVGGVAVPGGPHLAVDNTHNYQHCCGHLAGGPGTGGGVAGVGGAVSRAVAPLPDTL